MAEAHRDPQQPPRPKAKSAAENAAVILLLRRREKGATRAAFSPIREGDEEEGKRRGSPDDDPEEEPDDRRRARVRTKDEEEDEEEEKTYPEAKRDVVDVQPKSEEGEDRRFPLLMLMMRSSSLKEVEEPLGRWSCLVGRIRRHLRPERDLWRAARI